MVKPFIILLFLRFICIAQTLPKWEKGMMDIHHIQTGRGNATYMIFPDGTTLLFDAGEISECHGRTISDRNSSIVPNKTKRAHEWIVNYIKTFNPFPNDTVLNYVLVSHFHDDHFGEWDSTLKKSLTGEYFLTGITGVGEYLKFEKLIDRGHYTPVNIRSAEFLKAHENDEYHLTQSLKNYFLFIMNKKKVGMVYDSFTVGSNQQLKLKYEADRYTNWKIQNVSGAGKVYTGYRNNENTSIVKNGIYPGENPLSLGIKISYGSFDYFTGGDISGINSLGQEDYTSMESYVAPVVGPVDVATINHHGNRDAQSPMYVRILRPRVWIQQTWSSDHPGAEVLNRITSSILYPGERDIFATDLLPSNINVMGKEYINKYYKSDKGHIVIRVIDGGAKYMIYVLDDVNPAYPLKSFFGPYLSR